jgi:hypothetical protein
MFQDISGSVVNGHGCSSRCFWTRPRPAGGLSFELEPGVRVPKETEHERHSVFAPEVLAVGFGRKAFYRMYYAGGHSPGR